MDEISNKTKPKDIQEALEKLPQGLNDTYDRTIDRIRSQGSESWNLARKVLLWLSNALKPLSLEALQEAVAVETGMTSIAIRDLDDIHAADNAIADYTLQEYLNKNQDILSPNPHAEITSTCLAFLSFDDFNNKPPEVWYGQHLNGYRIPCDKALPDNPYHFTFYAVLSWGLHAQMAGETAEVMDAAVDFLSRPANVAYNWLVFWIAKRWTRLGGAFSGDRRLPSYEDLLKDADLFRLLLPVQFGLKGFLMELLKRHTRPAENALDTVISRLACHAARCGYKEIVRLLLTQTDVDWNMRDSNGQILITVVDEDNLRTLLHKENCSVNATSEYGSALHAADEPSRVRILLEAGGDVGVRNKWGEPVIVGAMTACDFGESWGEMIGLLVEYKADINGYGPGGLTALHLAADIALFDASEHLVSKGANPNLPNGQGQTPLDMAEETAASQLEHDTDSEFEESIAKNLQVLREAGGKTAKELSQSSIGEQGPSFPREWLDRLKDIQERGLPIRPSGWYWSKPATGLFLKNLTKK